MQPILALRHDALPWQPAETLPKDRFVLSLIRSVDPSRAPKLVFAKATEDGTALGSGGELNYDWSVAGWLDEGLEADLWTPGVAQAEPVQLAWEEAEDGTVFSRSPLGDTYQFDPKRRMLTVESDQKTWLTATAETFRNVAQADFEAQVRAAMTETQT